MVLPHKSTYYCFLRRISLSHFPYAMTIILLFSDWSDEAVSNAEILRLIYQGRFLHCNVTLSALGLATGKTTVMHLVPRENLPEPNSQGMYSIIIRHNTPLCNLTSCAYHAVSNLLIYMQGHVI